MSQAVRRTATSAAIVGLVVAAIWMVPGVRAQQVSRPAADAFKQLHWRFIGPEGNRVSAVAGIPGDPLVYYAGAASGGVFKTIDGGLHWRAIFDDQPVLSIGSIAVAPSDPNVVWAGTGEGKIRSHISVGQGIYKSTDAGKTWSLMGLEKTGRIPRLVIDPRDPNVLLACALGHAYGPQPERGVFRTADGGKTWNQVLFVDENTGCSDIAMDPKNPRILFAGMWHLEIHTWGHDSGGPGSGLFMSRDGGITWKRLIGHGLPSPPVGKVAVAIAPSNPKRVYALIETGDGIPWNGKETNRGQIWRTDDGGETWRMISTDRNAMGRSHYYSRMAVAPDNENETYYLTGVFSKSIDGGLTLVPQTRWVDAPGSDHHDIWIDPTNANRMIVGSDLCVSITQNRGAAATWNRVKLPIAQMYHVTADNQIPYYVYGNRQDGPSYKGPSNSRLEPLMGSGMDPGIPRSLWYTVSGGESGWATPDPVDPNVVWTSGTGMGMVGGVVLRYEEKRRQVRNVEVWPDEANGPAIDQKYRFIWDAPFLISPHDHNTIYTASQYVHHSTNGGQSWQVISPDLTLNDKSRMESSGGLTPDNIGVEYAGTVYSLAESPKAAGLLWAGTNDGLLHITRDGGKTWTNVTKNIPNLPPWGSFHCIKPSRYDAKTAYVTVDFHQVNNRDPFIYKTADYGQTWKAITNGIPHSMLSYAHWIEEDPVRHGLLYVGTENAIYVSLDDGENWQPLQADLPHAPVYGIVVQERFNDLVIGTYGRGFYILDDITPLQQLTQEVLAADAHLFTPRPAYRFRGLTGLNVIRDEDPSVGENPAYGATINYYLKTAPAGKVTVTILDTQGQAVRTLPGTRVAGLNRINWDLRGELTASIKLRTTPLYAPDVRLGPDGTRPAPDGGRMSILQPPGTYTVKLSAGGREFTQSLIVLKDPHSDGTEADIQAQMKTLSDLRTDIESAGALVQQIEVVRSQIEDHARFEKDAAVKKAGDDLNQKLIAMELNLTELRMTGSKGDGTRWGAKLIGKLHYLASQLASADAKPTDQQLEVRKLLEERLAGWQKQFKAIQNRELAAYNELLRKRSVPRITTS